MFFDVSVIMEFLFPALLAALLLAALIGLRDAWRHLRHWQGAEENRRARRPFVDRRPAVMRR